MVGLSMERWHHASLVAVGGVVPVSLLVLVRLSCAFAGEGESLRTEIVLASFAEDLSWVSAYVGKENIDVTVYEKGQDFPFLLGVKTLPLPNVGRESHTFLHHIVHNYDKLADWTVFSQATPPSWGYLVGSSTNGHLPDKVSFDDYVQPFPHGRDSTFVLNAATQFPRGLQITRLGLMKQGLNEESSDLCPKLGADGWSDWWFSKDHPHVKFAASMVDFYHRYIALDEDDGKPLTIAFAQGARFAVSRERIRSRPLRYYARLLNLLSRHRGPTEGYWMEASWYDVFHPELVQSRRVRCQLPAVADAFTVGPYVHDLLRKRFIRAASPLAGASEALKAAFEAECRQPSTMPGMIQKPDLPIHEVAAMIESPTRGEVASEARENTGIPDCMDFDKCVEDAESVAACCQKSFGGSFKTCGICLKAGCLLRADFCGVPENGNRLKPHPYCWTCFEVADLEENQGLPRPSVFPKRVRPESKASATELQAELQTVMLKLSELAHQNGGSSADLRESDRKLERVLGELYYEAKGGESFLRWTQVPLKAIPSLMLKDWMENQQ